MFVLLLPSKSHSHATIWDAMRETLLWNFLQSVNFKQKMDHNNFDKCFHFIVTAQPNKTYFFFLQCVARNFKSFRCADMNLNRHDAAAESVSKSIPNDLEDAEGKLPLCKSAIHKGQMFLSILSTGRPHKLSEYHRLRLRGAHWRWLGQHHPHSDIEGKQQCQTL